MQNMDILFFLKVWYSVKYADTDVLNIVVFDIEIVLLLPLPILNTIISTLQATNSRRLVFHSDCKKPLGFRNHWAILLSTQPHNSLLGYWKHPGISSHCRYLVASQKSHQPCMKQNLMNYCLNMMVSHGSSPMAQKLGRRLALQPS